MTDNSQKQRSDSLFLQLVLSFQAAAWQQMGKVKNPVTQKIERDLNQARFSIDILVMLKEKTKGNLSEDEERFLSHVLSELQLNYVAEVDKDQKEKEKSEEKKEEKKAEKENPKDKSSRKRKK